MFKKTGYLPLEFFVCIDKESATTSKIRREIKNYLRWSYQHRPSAGVETYTAFLSVIHWKKIRLKCFPSDVLDRIRRTLYQKRKSFRIIWHRGLQKKRNLVSRLGFSGYGMIGFSESIPICGEEHVMIYVSITWVFTRNSDAVL